MMKTHRRWVIGLALLAIGILAPATAVGADGGAEISRSDVFAFPAPGEDLGAPSGRSQLVRTTAGVQAQLVTDGLQAGYAYTLWWVIFNAPDGCSGTCGEDDIFDATGNFAPNPDANFALAWATGTVARMPSANFEARLREGEPVGELVYGPGLISSRDSEIHLVVRSHGPALGGDALLEQLTTFAGGCDVNDCVDTHFAVHRPHGAE